MSVVVRSTIAKPTGLGRYLNSPKVSTNTTPDTNSTADLADQIDAAQGAVNVASFMGLVAPTTQKPSAGAATAVVKTRWSPVLVSLLVVGLVVIIVKS